MNALHATELLALGGAGQGPAEEEERSEQSPGLWPAGRVALPTPRRALGARAGRTWPQSDCPPLSCILLLTHILFKTHVLGFGKKLKHFFLLFY